VRTAGLLFHVSPLATLKAETADLASGRAPGQRVVLDVAVFKARHGLTRKHAIPLLEWLDRERVTRRIGATRVVL
jgi:selenocysteine-specific elongation factor